MVNVLEILAAGKDTIDVLPFVPVQIPPYQDTSTFAGAGGGTTGGAWAERADVKAIANRTSMVRM